MGYKIQKMWLENILARESTKGIQVKRYGTTSIKYEIRLKNTQLLFTAVTTNTRPQGVFSSVQTWGLMDVNQPLPWFSRVGQEKILYPFLEHSEENVGV